MAAGAAGADILNAITRNLEAISEREQQVQQQEEDVARQRMDVEGMQREVEAERERVAGKEKDLETEKEAMMKFPVSDDDVVELNVQGKIMTTLRSTLTRIPDNNLCFLFNGRWEDKIHRDKEGRVFLDFIPCLFRILLDYLTTLKLAKSTDEIPLPKVSGRRALEFQMMIRFLGLEDALFGGPRCFSRSLKSSSVIVSDDGTIVTSDTEGMCFALGEGLYKNEKVEFVFEIRKLEQPWMFLGIIQESSTPPHDNSFNGNTGAYGWAGLGGVWVAGYRQAEGHEMPLDLLQAGCVVHLVLDCRNDKENSLELVTQADNSPYRIDGLPPGESWRIHVNMVGMGDAVQLQDVKRCQD